MENVKIWTDKLSKFLKKEINERMDIDTSEYSLEFRQKETQLLEKKQLKSLKRVKI